jgi:hypothetical protein
VTGPARTDPEVAAITFRRDLDKFWDRGAAAERGWQRRTHDQLTELITLQGNDGTQVLPYYLRVRADWYPDFPPQITLLEPDWVTEPPERSTWLPTIQNPPFQFGLHHVYDYRNPDTQELIDKRQLICFSHSFDYYVSSHTPQSAERWEHPRHTVAATLNRLHQVLQPPCYTGPQSPREPQAEQA